VRQRVLKAISAYLTSIGAAPAYWTSPFSISRAMIRKGEVEVVERRGVFLDKSYFERYVHVNEASIDPDAVSFTLDCSFYIYASKYFPYMRFAVEALAVGEAGGGAEDTAYSIWLLHPNGKQSLVEGPIYRLELRVHGGLTLLSYRLFWIYPWAYTIPRVTPH